MTTPASALHRLGFWSANLRERWSPTVRWPLHVAARLHRWLHADVPLVAVTGSNGKTTTTGLIAAILGSRFSVIATRDNQNSDTLFHRYVLRSRRGTNQALVLECGIQRPGNADRFNRVLDPDVLVVTNIGDTHLAFLGSREGVAAEKLALARNLRPGGAVVLNADDPLLASARLAARTITFAVRASADFVAHDVRASPDGLRLEIVGPRWRLPVRSSLVGPHHAYAILAAAACASFFDIEPEAIAGAVESFQPEPLRMQRIERGGWTIVDDSYSANPQSVLAAVEALATLPGRKALVLGDMAGLGAAGARLHRELGRTIARRHPELHLFAYGTLPRLLAEECAAAGLPPERVFHTCSKIDLLVALERFLAPGDVVLVKGSHGLRMGEVTAALGQPPYAAPLEPMPPVRAVGVFGAQRDPDRRHQGIDLPAGVGAPVRAFADGEVLSARYEPAYGRTLRIRHFTNVVTVYAHLSRILVRRGPVARGQPVAASGRSAILRDGSEYDYPHLHFEVRVDGLPVDPARYWPELVAGVDP